MKTIIIKTILFLNLVLLLEPTYSQNHWSIINDSISLSPNKFEGEGSLSIIADLNTNQTVDEHIAIYLKEKK